MSDGDVAAASGGPGMEDTHPGEGFRPRPGDGPTNTAHQYGPWQWSWDPGDHDHSNRPDAVDDAGTTSEDVPVRLEVLANDDDAGAWDGLRIESVTDPAHGTAAIGADGRTILYTPDRDYSGADGFSYGVRNLKGTDTADVSLTVQAVADAPEVAVEVVEDAADPANVVTLRVTAAVTDSDGSEYIDRLEFTGLPVGASVQGAPGGVFDEQGTPGTVTRDVKLVLPLGQDAAFDLGVVAVSKEASNGDEAGATATNPIVLDANTTRLALTFQARDQSIWGTGDEFTFDDDRFLGVDVARSGSGGFGPVQGTINASLKAGLQSDLAFSGGEIDATLPYDLTVSTNYNRTTDALRINLAAELAPGAGFQTVGPRGSYSLDFIFNYALSANAGLDLGVLGEYDLFGFSLGPSNNTTNLLSLDSGGLSETIALPLGISGTLAWPDVTTTGSVSAPGTISSEGASNNFLQLDVDVDQALADIFLGGANPFDVSFDIGVAEGRVELLDFVLSGGANFVERFDLNSVGLSGTMRFEDGTTRAFATGTDLDIAGASSLDADGDGVIAFDLTLAPNATLRNDTDLGFNVGYDLDLLELSGSYDILFDSGSFSLGPLVAENGTTQAASISVFDGTFPLDFVPETASFVV